ncbi:MAG: copper chaperone PCu(A)C, partial [Pontibacterium sp.]
VEVHAHGENHHHHDKNERLAIEKPWVRAMPSGAKMSAAYMSITNHEQKAVSLIGVKSDVADKVELHLSREKDGVMKMEQVDSVFIASNQTRELKPGGYHVMFIGLKRPLVEGEKVRLTLMFSHGERVTLLVPVQKSMMPTHNHHH